MTARSRLLSRSMLAAFVFAGLLVASASFALACSCVRFANAEAHLAQTDVVFVAASWNRGRRRPRGIG
jgi:hypothetical protein